MRLTLCVTITLVVFAIGLAACGTDCTNEPIANLPSPNGEVRAVLFGRSCGATSGFSTQISILSKDAPFPSEAGNALVLEGEIPIHMHWQSNRDLELMGLGRARVFRQEATVAGISVSYKH